MQRDGYGEVYLFRSIFDDGLALGSPACELLFLLVCEFNRLFLEDWVDGVEVSV